MCLIIKKPAGRRITADFLEHAWERNSHGWGTFHVEGGKVLWSRGLKLSELIVHNAQLPLDTEVFLHVRKATVGEVNEEMAHPYWVRDGLMLMHNGTIRHLAPSDRSRSDSFELARLLRDMLQGLDDAQAAALIRSSGFLALTAPLVQGSMVVLLDRHGAVRLGRDWHTVQAHEWDGAMPGIEVSNTHAWVPKSARRPGWRQWAHHGVGLLGARLRLRRSAA
jgi:glutamine phosphoribosylpyrophosphate amidotransferase